MLLLIVAFFTTIAHYLCRAVEMRIHRFNIDFMEFVEADERGKKSNRTFLVILALAPAIFLLEAVVGNYTLSSLSCVYGLSILGVSLALRLWAIDTVGRMWSLRILFVPGTDRVRTGPYRFFDHPEYLSRFLDLLALAMIWQAWWSLSFILPLLLVFGAACGAIERRQMSELAGLSQ